MFLSRAWQGQVNLRFVRFLVCVLWALLYGLGFRISVLGFGGLGPKYSEGLVVGFRRVLRVWYNHSKA